MSSIELNLAELIEAAKMPDNENAVLKLLDNMAPGEEIGYPPQYSSASLVAQTLKNPPAMQETWL